MDNNEEMFEKIWREQKILLGEFNTKNPKQLILIAGVPGSGKTTLLKSLQERINALYIRSDDIRDILNREYSDNILANNSQLKDQYLEYIFGSYISKCENQRIIIDMSMDRESNFLIQLADKYGYPKIIISLNCPEEILVERLSKRESTYVDEFLKNLPRWINDHEAFNNLNIADLVFDTEKENIGEMVEEILMKLQQ